MRLDEQMQNIDANDSQPDNTAPRARPDQTAIITRGVMRLFLDLGWSPLAEFKLANGRRADVAGLDRRGRVIIAEVKSCRADFEVDQKWPDYLDFCDEFFFAVDQSFPVELLPESEGLIFADGFGAQIQRAAPERSLAPARRKAVTLRFARQAARRISSIDNSSVQR